MSASGSLSWSLQFAGRGPRQPGRIRCAAVVDSVFRVVALASLGVSGVLPRLFWVLRGGLSCGLQIEVGLAGPIAQRRPELSPVLGVLGLSPRLWLPGVGRRIKRVVSVTLHMMVGSRPRGRG